MQEVLPLSVLSRALSIQVLLSLRDVSNHVSIYLMNLLRTELYTAVSEPILRQIVEHFPSRVRGDLVKVLSPPHIRELSMRKCIGVSVSSVREILAKCSRIEKLDVSECEQLMRVQFFQDDLPTSAPNLTCLIVENCKVINDTAVRCILKSNPLLKQLNISMCEKITDHAFLLDEQLQLSRETNIKVHGHDRHGYMCQLSHIDVSGCRNLTSSGIRFLTTLCGPTLQHVNISYTEVDSTGLWYLSGYGLTSAVHMALAYMVEVNTDETSSEQLSELVKYMREVSFSADDVISDGEVEDDSDASTAKEDETCEDCVQKLKGKGVEHAKTESEGATENENETENTHTAVESESGSLVFKVELIPLLKVHFNQCTCREDGAELDNQCKDSDENDKECNASKRQWVESSYKSANCLACHPPSCVRSEPDTEDIADTEDTEVGRDQVASTSSIKSKKCHCAKNKTDKSGRNVHTKKKLSTSISKTSSNDKERKEDSNTMEDEEGEGEIGGTNTTEDEEGEGEIGGTNTMENEERDGEIGGTNTMEDEERDGEIGAGGACGGRVSSTSANDKEHKFSNTMDEEDDDDDDMGGGGAVGGAVAGPCIGGVSAQDMAALATNALVAGCNMWQGTASSAAVMTKSLKPESSMGYHNETVKLPKPASKTLPSTTTKSYKDLLQIYEPDIRSLDISLIALNSKQLVNSCLKTFFQRNKRVQQLHTSWKGMSDNMLMFMADHAPHLNTLSLIDCDGLSSESISHLIIKCPLMSRFSLRGVCFIGDQAFQPTPPPQLTTLNLAETNITDNTLASLAKHNAETLRELDLSWCDEIITCAEDYCPGLNAILTECKSLQRLLLRRLMPMPTLSIRLLADNCIRLRELNLSSVGTLEDEHLATMSVRMTQLRKLDVSWNMNVKDEGVRCILMRCVHLEELNVAGNKRLTSAPFLPIISDLVQWRKCQALFRLKLHEKKQLAEDEHYSSDEEFEALHLPARSLVYGVSLRWLDGEYCDRVEDQHLAELVAVCRGSLRARDYYGQNVVPDWFKLP